MAYIRYTVCISPPADKDAYHANVVTALTTGLDPDFPEVGQQTALPLEAGAIGSVVVKTCPEKSSLTIAYADTMTPADVAVAKAVADRRALVAP